MREKGAIVVGPFEFVALTWSIVVPSAVGVPEITESVNIAQDGSPLAVQVIGPGPVALRVSLYDTPIVPARTGDLLVIVGTCEKMFVAKNTTRQSVKSTFVLIIVVLFDFFILLKTDNYCLYALSVFFDNA